MTQLDTSPAPDGGPVPSEPAPAPAAVPAAPAADQQQPGGDDADYIRVPRDSLGDFGGSWHEAARLAKQAQQATKDGLFDAAAVMNEYGYTPQQWVQYQRTQTTEPPAEPAPPQPPAEFTTGSALTEERFMELMAKREQDAAEQSKKQQYEQAKQQAREDQDAFADKFAEELGLSPDSVRATVVKAIATDALRAELAKPFAADYTISAAQKAQIVRELSPSPEQAAAALEAAKAVYADIGNEFASEKAMGQRHVPSQTLGRGAGGPQAPPKTIDDMTAEEIFNAVVPEEDFRD